MSVSTIQGKTPLEFAESWYSADSLRDSIKKTGVVPRDVYSQEFADWLAAQYQYAMARGISLAFNEVDRLNPEKGV